MPYNIWDLFAKHITEIIHIAGFRMLICGFCIENISGYIYKTPQFSGRVTFQGNEHINLRHPAKHNYLIWKHFVHGT